MQLHVRLCNLVGVAALCFQFEVLASFFQFCKLIFRDALACQLYRQRVQRPAHLQNVPQVLFRDLRHLCAASWNHRNEPLQLQLADRLADRRPGHSELIRQMNFHQALPRL